jgi:hypothetical protein
MTEVDIVETYKRIHSTARSLAEEDQKLDTKGSLTERTERHILGMLEMFAIVHGQNEQG